MASAEPQASPVPLREVQAPMLESPVPQGWHVDEAEVNGVKAVILTVMSPFCTMKLGLDEQSGIALAEAVRSKFSGLTVAREIPHPGGPRD